MRLIAARVQNYRSVRDTGWFDVEDAKTILVGPNEAGKTAVLEALQRINAPDDVQGFNELRDYPRGRYNADLQSGRLSAGDIVVASAKLRLDPDDLAEISEGFDDAVYIRERRLNNTEGHWIQGGPEYVKFTEDVRKDLERMALHVEKQTAVSRGEDEALPSATLQSIIGNWLIDSEIRAPEADQLRA